MTHTENEIKTMYHVYGSGVCNWIYYDLKSAEERFIKCIKTSKCKTIVLEQTEFLEPGVWGGKQITTVLKKEPTRHAIKTGVNE